MRYRPLGNTGLSVSEIGFGGLGIGGVSRDVFSYGPADDRESLAALERALERGINFFDTSPSYGAGHSEELLGRAFGGRRERAIIASKVGHVSIDQPDDSSLIGASLAPEAMRRSLEGTLRRLASDYVDLLQLHSPPLEVLSQRADIFATLENFRHEGKIRAWGISLRSPADGAPAIAKFGVPVIQTNFNMIDERALDNGLLELARVKGVGVIARTPFNYGFLTGTVNGAAFPAGDHRALWPAEQIERWTEAPKLFAPLNAGKERSLAALALQFCLFPESVASVIPGMMHPVEVDGNAAALDGPPLGAEEFEMIRGIYRAHEFKV